MLNTKKMAAFSLGALMILSLAGSAFAGPLSNQFHDRMHNQHERIQKGRSCGELTRKEAHRLGRNQQDIRQYLRRAKADDGRISRAEALRLDQMMDRQNRAIYHQKHDNQDRW